jgi:pimeloyl-ACP methyl ester carboxylesterase
VRAHTSKKTNGELFASRILHARGPEPALEFIETNSRSARGAPILFIHGAFVGAWMWAERFLPYFAAQGRYAAAVSLRGHGKSHGRDHSRPARLSDYLSDVCRAIDEFAEPPIILAHSLGALLAQRLLGRVDIRALVMLAPLPPEGLMFLGPWLFATKPRTWLDMVNATLGPRDARKNRDGARHIVFSKLFSPAEARRYASLMVAEGSQALMEAHMPQPIISAHLLRIPSLVIAGGDDPLVSYAATLRTAAYHGAHHICARDAGHLLPIEPAADWTASRVLAWIEQKGL